MKNPNTEMLQCINEKALSDFKLGTEAGECSHETFELNCGIPVQISGENSCCARQCENLAGCKASLDFCFLQMWDEGRNYAEPGSVQNGITGHYDNMVAVDFEFAVCGFAFSSTDNSGWMTQNFFRSEGVINDKCAYDCENNPDSCGTCHTEAGTEGSDGGGSGGDVPVYDLNNNDYELGAALRQESGGGVPIILTIAFLTLIFVCVMLILKNGAPCGQCCERHTGGDGLPKADDSGTTTSNPTVGMSADPDEQVTTEGL